MEGCDKSAQSSTNFCVKHGGGKKCQFHGCEKVARGKTLFCAAVSVHIMSRASDTFAVCIAINSLFAHYLFIEARWRCPVQTRRL